MSDVGDAYDEIRAELDSVAADILPDVCSFVGPGSETRDSWGEVTTGDETEIASCPCEYTALSAYERSTGGSVTSVATHKLKVPVNAETMAIQANFSGVIAARGLVPAKSFQVTGPLDSSTDIWLYLAITIK